MRKLILIKHARPAVDPSVAAEEWQLSPEGREGAGGLIERLRPYAFSRLFSSGEPKALQTAQLIGAALARPVEQVSGLEEHDRRDVPHMESREFISMMALLFSQPERLVLGNETADEAYARFDEAIDGTIEREAGDVAVVTHGTVISLFSQRRAKVEPFGLWRRMGLPSFIVFEMPAWRVAEVCERV
jgi:broad specificity phosphatase PhoE